MGNCCGGAGCCVIPKGSCPARGGQVVSILGLIFAAIFLVIGSLVIPMWYVAAIAMAIGLPGLGIGIWIANLNLYAAIVVSSRPALRPGRDARGADAEYSPSHARGRDRARARARRPSACRSAAAPRSRATSARPS